MAGDAYQGYWKHKLEQLWKEVEGLKSRVAELEHGAPKVQPAPKPQPEPQPGLVPVNVQEGSNIVPPAPVIEGKGHTDEVVELLQDKGPLNVVDINAGLRSKGTDETVRDTLFNRLKPLMKKGAVDYDEGTQMFSAR
jgi:hypothetical protein